MAVSFAVIVIYVIYCIVIGRPIIPTLRGTTVLEKITSPQVIGVVIAAIIGVWGALVVPVLESYYTGKIQKEVVVSFVVKSSLIAGLVIVFWILIVGGLTISSEPPVTPTPTPTATATPTPGGPCTNLEVPAFLAAQREVSGTAQLSAPAHLSPKVILSPEGCKAELTYRWFSDGKPMPEYDDFQTIPLSPQYLLAEQTLRVEIYLKPIGKLQVASIKIVVSK